MELILISFGQFLPYCFCILVVRIICDIVFRAFEGKL